LRGGGGQAREAEKASEAGGIATLLKYKKFQNVLILYGREWPFLRLLCADPLADMPLVNNAVMFSWEAIFPLFAFTSANLGGLGLTTQQIGVVLAASAGLSIAMTIWIFPIAHKSMSEGNMLRVCEYG
jgi:hypothetical protein